MAQGKELSNSHSEPTTSRIVNVISSSTCNVPPVDAANQHSFTTMKRIPYENKCLQPYRNKMKLALIITVLTVVMVTVPTVYTSVTNQKTEIHNINTSSVKTEMPNTKSSVLTQMTEVPTVDSHLTFNGM